MKTLPVATMDASQVGGGRPGRGDRFGEMNARLATPSAMTNLAVVMTVDDLAAYLQIGPKSLYKLAAAGQIPAIKIAGYWRFYRPTIDAWLKTLSLQNYAGPELLPDEDNWSIEEVA